MGTPLFGCSATAAAATIWPIVKFDADYVLLEKIGQGKFGEVFKIEDCRSRMVHAAKMMRCSRASEKLRVRDEIEILSGLEHPNVLKLVGAYEDSENFIQVLEYLSGGQLFESIVKQGTCSGGSFSEAQISFVVKQICSGVEYIAARNIIHLDLKPENIVCVRPESFLIKIVDFGFARRLDPPADIRVTEGTPEFVSPEVINYDPIALTTDMWSVGVIAYVLLSGLSPFLGADNEETFDNITGLRYSFQDPEFETVSAAAISFVSFLLVVDASRRPSATQALEHSWLSADDDVDTVTAVAAAAAEGEGEGRSLRERLEHFVAKRRWQKCGNVIMVCNALLHNQRRHGAQAEDKGCQ